MSWQSAGELPAYIFGLSFFIIVSLLLLAIIAGIVIDMFGEMRDMQRVRREDTCLPPFRPLPPASRSVYS